MKTVIIAALLLLTSMAFAGGAGASLTSTFAECQSPDGDKVSILFNETSGYFLNAEIPIDFSNKQVKARDWEIDANGFSINFIGDILRGKFTSKQKPFESTNLDQVGELYALSDKFAYTRLACLHR